MKGLNQFMRTVFWIVIIPLILYTLFAGFVLGEVEFPGGFRITFQPKVSGTTKAVEGDYGDLHRDEKEDRAKELQRELKALRRKVERSSASSPGSYDLSGSWRSAGGASYRVFQNGSSFTIRELSAYGMVTAVGQGQVMGRSIQLSYQTATYSQGAGELTLSPDGRSMSGYFKDLTYGTTIPITLYR